jgi:hypothetical protein
MRISLEFHQRMNLTMTVWMKHDQVIKTITTTLAPFHNVVDMNTGFAFKLLLAKRT